MFKKYKKTIISLSAIGIFLFANFVVAQWNSYSSFSPFTIFNNIIKSNVDDQKVQITGDFQFDDEIMPDGVTCSNDEILKKTGADDWDCAADDDTTDHGALTGLADDDHTQYILVNGTRAFTGNQSHGDNNITNLGELDLDLMRADAANGSITIELDNAAGADLLIGNNNALVVEGDNDRVGIGTNAPSRPLHVIGETRIQADGDNSADRDMLNFLSSGGALRGEIVIGSDATFGEDLLLRSNTGLRFITDANDASPDEDIIFAGGSAPTEFMRILGSGNVGINQAAPTAMMHIVPNSTTTPGLYIKQNASFSSNTVQITDSSDNPHFYVNSAGNVGIGVSNPRVLLSVKSTSSTIGAAIVNIGDQNNLGRIALLGSTTSEPAFLVGFPLSGAYWKAFAHDAAAGSPSVNYFGFEPAANVSSPRYLIFGATAGGLVDGFGINTGASAPEAMLHVNTTASTTIGQIIEGVASQTGDMWQVKNNTGGILAKIEDDGKTTFQNDVDSTTAIQFKDSAGNVDVNYDSTNGRVGIGTTSPLAMLQINQPDSNTAGIVIAGTAIDGSSQANQGIFLGLNHNSDGNRQFVVSETDSFGSATRSMFRYLAGDRIASVDAVTANGASRLPVNFGSVTSDVSVGDGTVAFNATLPGKFSIFTQAAKVGLAITGSSGQTGSLFIMTDNSNNIFFDSGDGLANSTVDWNVQEADIDFNIRATGATNAFFVQGSDGNIGIGTGSPANKLQIAGNMTIGVGSAGVDYTRTYDGESNNCIETYFEDENIISYDCGVNLSGISKTVVSITNADSPYTVLATDDVIICDATDGNTTINLPAISTFLSNSSKAYRVKKIDVSANTCIIDGNGAETIDDGATATITSQYEAFDLEEDDSEWWVF